MDDFPPPVPLEKKVEARLLFLSFSCFAVKTVFSFPWLQDRTVQISPNHFERDAVFSKESLPCSAFLPPSFSCIRKTTSSVFFFFSPSLCVLPNFAVALPFRTWSFLFSPSSPERSPHLPPPLSFPENSFGPQGRLFFFFSTICSAERFFPPAFSFSPLPKIGNPIAVFLSLLFLAYCGIAWEWFFFPSLSLYFPSPSHPGKWYKEIFLFLFCFK